MRAVPGGVEDVHMESKIFVHAERVVFSEAERQIVLADNVGGKMQDEDQPAGRQHADLETGARALWSHSHRAFRPAQTPRHDRKESIDG